MSMPSKPQKGFREIDFRVGVTVMLAAVVYHLLCMISKNTGNYINLCILSICTAFLADVDWRATWKAGINRMKITFIGALAALPAVFVYNMTKSEALLIAVSGAGAVLVLVLAKFTNAMYVQCRLALVAYILTIYTFHGAFYESIGKTCYGYCLMWILSTALGALISVVCAFVWDAVKNVCVKKITSAD